MTTYNVLEAKSNLSKLIDAVESGRESEIVIARNGKPAARLVPLATKASGDRIGIAKGKFTVPASLDGADEIVTRLFLGETD
jgi:prevent-host-death family protein